ncbi:MAG TPA: hypothetical protein VFU70_01165, partial [Pseudolabrys sp.]|nr:hypothetical protein [Pseudolabrys sp.]
MERLAPVASRNVAVISGDDANDLAARLGRQLINAVLPGECRVHYLTAGKLDSGAAELRSGARRHFPREGCHRHLRHPGP